MCGNAFSLIQLPLTFLTKTLDQAFLTTTILAFVPPQPQRASLWQNRQPVFKLMAKRDCSTEAKDRVRISLGGGSEYMVAKKRKRSSRSTTTVKTTTSSRVVPPPQKKKVVKSIKVMMAASFWLYLLFLSPILCFVSSSLDSGHCNPWHQCSDSSQEHQSGECPYPFRPCLCGVQGEAVLSRNLLMSDLC